MRVSEKFGCSSWKSQQPHTSHQGAAPLAWYKAGATGSSAQVQEELAELSFLSSPLGQAEKAGRAVLPSQAAISHSAFVLA